MSFSNEWRLSDLKQFVVLVIKIWDSGVTMLSSLQNKELIFKKKKKIQNTLWQRTVDIVKGMIFSENKISHFSVGMFFMLYADIISVRMPNNALGNYVILKQHT